MDNTVEHLIDNMDVGWHTVYLQISFMNRAWLGFGRFHSGASIPPWDHDAFSPCL